MPDIMAKVLFDLDNHKNERAKAQAEYQQIQARMKALEGLMLRLDGAITQCNVLVAAQESLTPAPADTVEE